MNEQFRLPKVVDSGAESIYASFGIDGGRREIINEHAKDKFAEGMSKSMRKSMMGNSRRVMLESDDLVKALAPCQTIEEIVAATFVLGMNFGKLSCDVQRANSVISKLMQSIGGDLHKNGGDPIRNMLGNLGIDKFSDN